MESNSESVIKIDNLLSKIITMLRENTQSWWGDRMYKLLINLRKSDDKKSAAALIMKPMIGGMGSLADVALYRNGKALIEENRIFSKLLNELYEECERFSAGD